MIPAHTPVVTLDSFVGDFGAMEANGKVVTISSVVNLGASVFGFVVVFVSV